MIVTIKELIVVLAIAMLVFRLAKAHALRFSTPQDFSRRRNVWLALTTVAFLSSNFWLFILFAAPLLYWAGRKDTNPIALYLLVLHTIPDVPVDIPAVMVKELFPLDNYRLLSFCVLIPTAWAVRRANVKANLRGMTVMDYLLLAFGALQLLHYVPPDLPGQVLLHDSATNVLRRGFLFFVDIYVLYYVVSRTCTNRKIILEAMAAFCLASAIMALVAVFESLRHWLLYTDITVRWGQPLVSGYSYVRAGFLRGQASAGHAIALGYLLAVALGFWLYVRSQLESRSARIAGVLVFCMGLAATFSRGPWVGAIAIYFVFAALSPRTISRMFKTAAVLALAMGALSLTSAGQGIIHSLPYFGAGATVDPSALYRDRLVERSWEIIQQNPFLGDPLALLQMQDLRQGEGIIDIVNTYAEIALFYGLVGVVIFIGFLLTAFARTYWFMRSVAPTDPDLATLGASLAATIAGVLLMLLDSSFILGVPIIYYLLGGLAAGYVCARDSPEPNATTETRLRRRRVAANALRRPRMSAPG